MKMYISEMVGGKKFLQKWFDLQLGVQQSK